MQNESENQQPLYSGPVVAAGLSLLLAFLTPMISHHVSRLTKELDKIVHDTYGNWIPGSTGSGPKGRSVPILAKRLWRSMSGYLAG